MVKTSYGHSFWRHIVACFNTTRDLYKISVHSGAKISFLFDTWSGRKPLKELGPSIFKLSTRKEGSLSDYIIQTTQGSDWFIPFSRDPRTTEMQELLQLLQNVGTSPPTLDVLEDTIKWPFTKNGVYTVKTTYDHLLQSVGAGLFRQLSPHLFKVGIVEAYQKMARKFGTLYLQQCHGESGMKGIDECSTTNPSPRGPYL
ncbi:hypothetical protein BVC80_645g54 [Macleaya cordata]|uniref:Uncharacterized protein n=1 Tax=Macleaya cordata TaxID=56857 RepID=A0A200QJX9_MACCD|nr:hypothetical protein BVC80_645g54 [Macleaya cordata]